MRGVDDHIGIGALCVLNADGEIVRAVVGVASVADVLPVILCANQILREYGLVRT
ncbi:hypothetical protein D3C72_2043030 [compost metagenome]